MKLILKHVFVLGVIFMGLTGTSVYAGSGKETVEREEPDTTEFTPAQAAAIKAVTDAVATGNEAAVKSAISQQVALFPEITGAIVVAALNVQNTTLLMQKIIVRTAVIGAPGERSSILMAIKGHKSLISSVKIILVALVKQSLRVQFEWKVKETHTNPLVKMS